MAAPFPTPTALRLSSSPNFAVVHSSISFGVLDGSFTDKKGFMDVFSLVRLLLPFVVFMLGLVCLLF